MQFGIIYKRINPPSYMQQKNGSAKIEYLGWIILSLSIVYSLLLIGTGAFPYFGLALTFISTTLIIIYFKKERSLSTALLALAVIVLSAFLVLRTNWILITLNLITIFYLLSLLLHHSSNKRWYTSSIIISPFQILEALFSVDNVLSLSKPQIGEIEIDKDKVKKISISFVLTLGTLLIIIPLLAYSNPIFRDYIMRFFDLFRFDFSWIINFIFSGTIIARGLVAICFYYLISKALSFLKLNIAKKPIIFHNNLKNYLLATKIVVSSVLLIFFVSQFKIYTLTNEELLQLGYSHSEYTREIFAQLSIVSAIIIAFLYNSKHIKLQEKAVNYILAIEGIFLTIIAYKSVITYIQTWGFTTNRLYGAAGATWLLCVFIILIGYFYLKKSRTTLIKLLLSLSVSTIVLINYLNFDYLIYHYSQSTTHVGIDYNYLAKLSYDADSQKEIFETVAGLNCDQTNENINTEEILNTSLNKILTANLDTYKDIRNFNLAIYRTRLKTEGLLPQFRDKQIKCTTTKEAENKDYKTIATYNINTRADAAWQNTGINLNAGDKLKIETTGEWTADYREPMPGENTNNALFGYVGAEGNVNLKDLYLCYGSQNKCAPRMMLIGRINNEVILIGKTAEFTAPQSGLLYLSANDGANDFGDNAGSIKSTITISKKIL